MIDQIKFICFTVILFTINVKLNYTFIFQFYMLYVHGLSE